MQEDLKKIAYMNAAEKIYNASFKNSLLTLLDMGFTDFERNQNVLIKHNGDISQAVCELYN